MTLFELMSTLVSDRHAPYVWGSFGVWALLIGLEVVVLRRGERSARAAWRQDVAARGLRHGGRDDGEAA